MSKTNILCHDDNAKIALSGEFTNGRLDLIMMRYREIYKKTIKKWGEEAQYDQMIEECAELIATLQHFSRGKVDSDVVVNELADVFLMVGQLTYMFGEDQLTAAVEEKVVKLQLLLDDGE
jgi:NTP pyrophosphatase (non-canonical NTP hydrolase)